MSGYAHFPGINKKEDIWKLFKSDKFFSFPKKDLLLSWKFKRWLQDKDRSDNDFNLMIIQAVQRALEMANWQNLAKPTTEYGIYLVTKEGSEMAQLKYFQEIQKQQPSKHFNPRLLPQLYANGVLNKLAKQIMFRGHSLIFWPNDVSVKQICAGAVQGMKYHQQKGCLVIMAEESAVNFGVGVVFLERVESAQARGVQSKYFLQLDAEGRILFEEKSS
ncbi:hypothetical protein ACFL5G_02615 [Candidatus Margulisiibacteriota bacterium]